MDTEIFSVGADFGPRVVRAPAEETLVDAGYIKIKANSAQLELELGLSLATFVNTVGGLQS